MECRAWWSLLLAAGISIAAGLASAQEPVGTAGMESLRKQVVGSMRLTGTLAVGPGGAVAGHVIDHSEKVPPEVLRHVARYVPRWRVVKSGAAGNKRFAVRVMATPRGDGNFALSLAGASISEKQDPAEMVVADGRWKRPDYPRSLGRIGVSGTVYVVMKVGRDGKVQDLVAEQVNLNLVGTPSEVARARADFAGHTAAAARQWKFRIPRTATYTDLPYLLVRVPVAYQLNGQGAYAEWEYYVPGPRRVASWMQDDGMALGAGEAGAPQVLGMGPRIEGTLEPTSG
jgi:hypothetical protein